jgi:hypothetical protein
LAQAIGQAAIQQNHRVMYRETHVLLDNLAEAVVEGTRKQFMDVDAGIKRQHFRRLCSQRKTSHRPGRSTHFFLGRRHSAALRSTLRQLS